VRSRVAEGSLNGWQKERKEGPPGRETAMRSELKTVALPLAGTAAAEGVE
jgi:hypothetical protein